MERTETHAGSQGLALPEEADLAIIGGGLAGLALSIQVADAGHRVVVLEKDAYPRHRVCGEYVSREALPFLRRIGLDMEAMDLPVIGRLGVSAPNGDMLRLRMPTGGVGVSRYRLDDALARLAAAKGVRIIQRCRVTEIRREGGAFLVQAPYGALRARMAVCAAGKRSNLDVAWNRDFVADRPDPLHNWIGVKYHIQADFPRDTIELHNFRDGYCGISAIEDGAYCLCYLTTAANLREHGNSIPRMERELLSRNPRLASILRQAVHRWEQPLTISQVSFARKSRWEDGVMMLGDAAGMITPLCGNGMSMALQGSTLAAAHAIPFLEGRTDDDGMRRGYDRDWRKSFAMRLATGRTIQRFFGSTALTALLVATLKRLPTVTRAIVAHTHGRPF